MTINKTLTQLRHLLHQDPARLIEAVELVKQNPVPIVVDYFDGLMQNRCWYGVEIFNDFVAYVQADDEPQAWKRWGCPDPSPDIFQIELTWSELEPLTLFDGGLGVFDIGNSRG